MHSKCVEMHSNANFIKPGFPKEGHKWSLAILVLENDIPQNYESHIKLEY